MQAFFLPFIFCIKLHILMFSVSFLPMIYIMNKSKLKGIQFILTKRGWVNLLLAPEKNINPPLNNLYSFKANGFSFSFTLHI